MERVVVDSVEGLDVLGLSKDEARARLVAGLKAAKFVVLDDKERLPDGVVPWRVIAAVQADEPDPEAGARTRVACAVSFHQKGGSESWETEGHAKLTPKSTGLDDVQQAARDGFEQALAAAVAEGRAVVEGLGLTDEQLVTRLAGPDGPSRNGALQLLARRHHPAAQKLLVERLTSDDVEAVHRTMGLLVEMRATAAVPALIEASHGRDPTFQREVVFALGEIGGEEAEAYLFTLAQGHDDPIVRASAEKALDDLKQRSEKQKPSTGEPR